MPTIVCFGDSNTHGTRPMRDLNDAGRFDAATRWPGRLATQLGPEATIIEEGHPGRTTINDDPIEGVHKNGFVGLQIALETHRPIDLVIIMLGTNDLKARFSKTGLDIGISAEKLLQLVAASEAGPGKQPPKCLLVAPPPILETGCLEEMFAGGAAKSQQFARVYAEAASRQRQAFFDAGRVIASSPMEGIHFEADAHQMLGDALASEVRSLLDI